MKNSLLIDTIALKCLAGKDLNASQLFGVIDSLVTIDISQTSKYQSVRRLREVGFIEEVPTKARDKTYRITGKGEAELKQILEFWRGK